jgi:hypothetical protein
MNWFDEFAKALGEGMSRREALRRAARGLAAVCGLGLAAGQAAGQAPSGALVNACRRSCRLYGIAGATDACVSECVRCSQSGALLCQNPAGGRGLYCCTPTATGTCPSTTDTCGPQF